MRLTSMGAFYLACAMVCVRVRGRAIGNPIHIGFASLFFVGVWAHALLTALLYAHAYRDPRVCGGGGWWLVAGARWQRPLSKRARASGVC